MRFNSLTNYFALFAAVYIGVTSSARLGEFMVLAVMALALCDMAFLSVHREIRERESRADFEKLKDGF